MKVQENITLYSCDFCKKRMVRKHAMIKHEPSCYSNPENKPACSDCKFLEEIKVEYYYDFGMGESRTATDQLLVLVAHIIFCNRFIENISLLIVCKYRMVFFIKANLFFKWILVRNNCSAFIS
mgnify:CR=1 FL=1